MSPTTKDASIEKLDGTNYKMWSFKMKTVLMSKNLWACIENPTHETPTEMMQKAYAEIIIRISDSQILHVMTATSPQEVWMVLQKIHANKDIASKMWLKEKFMTFRYNSPSMEKHIEELESLVMSMSGAGCKPDEDDICMVLLRSLPAKYESLVQAHRMSVTTLSFGDIVNRLISEDIRQMESATIEVETAMQAKFKGKKFKKKFDPVKRTSKDKKNVICYNCNKPGHYKNECKAGKNEGKDDAYVAFASEANAKSSASKWIVDSGASCHMVCDRNAFKEYQTQTQEVTVSVAKANTKLRVLGKGTVHVNLLVKGKIVEARLENTLHVENISRNLFSVSAVTEKGMTTIMDASGCQIMMGQKLMATGTKKGSLIYLDMVEDLQCHIASTSHSIWHRRFGHASNDKLKEMKKRGILPKEVQIPQHTGTCDVCAIAKQAKKKFPKKENGLVKEKGLVCSDVTGPITPESVAGAKYAVTFTVMDTRYVRVYPMKTKNEVITKLQEFLEEMKNGKEYRVKVLRSDNGGEYKSRMMTKYCNSMGIKQEFTIAHNPEQNGMSERANRTLVEMTRCMLTDSGMHKKYWAEAMVTAADTRNMISSKANQDTTPYEAMTGRVPDHASLRVFGCACFAHIPKANRKKLDNTGVKCRFLGYGRYQKGYRLMQESGKILYSRSIIWAEKDEPLEESDSDSDGEYETRPRKEEQDINMEHEKADVGQEKPRMGQSPHYMEPPATPPRRPRMSTAWRSDETGVRDSVPSMQSGTPGRDGEDERKVRPARKKRAIVRYQDEYDGLMCLMSEHQDEDATSFDQIMKSDDRVEWMDAMENEMKSIEQHETWDLVPLPKDKKAIGSRWLFKIKRNADGSVNKYKARLCAKGYTQRLGVDFNETFAPVAKMTSIRVMLAISAEMDLEVQQFDVNTAFLYGTIDEELYMKQPTGFEDASKPHHVCKLKKSLYGTKQAARQWNQRLDEYMIGQGFVGADADPCIYVRINDNEYTIMAVYVDDIITVSKDMKTIDEIKCELKKVFKIKDLGDMQYCLGIEIKRDRSQKTISMSQEGYVKKVAEKFGLQDCKPVNSPADENSKLKKMQDDELFKPCFPYREIVGSLMYAMVCTRPDIADAVGSVSKYCERHNNEHWIAAKRVVKYLKTTSKYAIKFNGNEASELVGYADANWASDPDTRKSTTGYVFLLNGGAVSWNSKRQTTVATSSTEAEYMSLYSAVQEAIWLRRLLKDLKYESSGAIKIYQDNQGTIALAKNPTFHSRTKHIDIKYHFAREQVKAGNIELEYLPTNDMVADALTKPLSRKKIEEFARAINLCNTCMDD